MECNFCENTFSTKGNLVAHQKKSKYCLTLQNKNPDKVYKCKYCEKEFTLKYSYADHIKIHESNPLFVMYYETIEEQKKTIEKLQDNVSFLTRHISELKNQVEYHKKQNTKLISDHGNEIRHYQVQHRKMLSTISNMNKVSCKTVQQICPEEEEEICNDNCLKNSNEVEDEEIENSMKMKNKEVERVINEMNVFYDSLDTMFKVGIDLSEYEHEDCLYISIFKPTEEYVRQNMGNVDFGNRVFFKFGVSGGILSRNDSHTQDQLLIDNIIIKVFGYRNFQGRRLGEKRLKEVLRHMKLKINYYTKIEIFLSSVEKFHDVIERMTEHNNMMNKSFDEKYLQILRKNI